MLSLDFVASSEVSLTSLRDSHVTRIKPRSRVHDSVMPSLAPPAFLSIWAGLHVRFRVGLNPTIIFSLTLENNTKEVLNTREIDKTTPPVTCRRLAASLPPSRHHHQGLLPRCAAPSTVGQLLQLANGKKGHHESGGAAKMSNIIATTQASVSGTALCQTAACPSHRTFFFFHPLL